MRLFASVLALVAASLFLPRTTTGQFTVGVVAGWTQSDITEKDVELTSRIGGVALGGQASVGVTSALEMQVEALYVQKGFRVAGTDTKYRLGYAELPLLLKLLVPVDLRSLQPVVFAGPSAAVNVGCKSKVGGAGEACDASVLDIEVLDLGFIAGGGVEYSADDYIVGLTGRYVVGLRGIEAGSDPSGSKNRVIQWHLGLGVRL